MFSGATVIVNYVMIFDIQGGWNKVLGIYIIMCQLIRAQRSCFTNGCSIYVHDADVSLWCVPPPAAAPWLAPVAAPWVALQEIIVDM